MEPPTAPINRTIRRTYKYRSYLTKTQIVAAEEQLRAACNLYNAALEHRKRLWGEDNTGRRRPPGEHGIGVSLYDQQKALTEVRSAGLLPCGMNAQSQQHVLRRLDLAFQAFYRRCKQGDTPGYPRHRSPERYNSLIWSCGPGGNGCRIRKDGLLALQGIGQIRVKWHRQFPEGATLKTTTLKRSAGRWYVYFSFVVPLPEPLPVSSEAIGVDLGITSFVKLSNDESIEGPRAYRKAQRSLRIVQRRVARRRRGSNRRKKAVATLVRKHEHIRNVRRDHAFKAARGLVDQYGLIAVEDLNVKGLAQGWLSKDVHDQGWAQFVSILRDKAEEAGREIVFVDPRRTSQTCPECGAVAKKVLGERIHNCPCGYVADRDTAAARVILQRALGRSVQALTVGEEVRAVA